MSALTAALQNIFDIQEARIKELEAQLAQPTHVDFYEREFYPLSNFSSFRLAWLGVDFDTSEHAYHWAKFSGTKKERVHQRAILLARSAHEAFKYAEAHKGDRRHNWDEIKVDVMAQICRAKADQHEYVRRKLLESGERLLIECSWRDDFWGWGPNRDGQNMLGKVWMQIRTELRLMEASESGS